MRKDIKGFEGLYCADSEGNIIKLSREKKDKRDGGYTKEVYLKPWKINSGYMMVGLSKDNKSQRFLVHRLVYNTFHEDLGDLYVNHIDGNKTNNNLDNLEKVTFIQNIEHAFETGLRDKEFSRTQSTISKEELDYCLKLLKAGKKRKEASRLSTVPTQTIANIIQGKIYKEYYDEFKVFKQKTR